MFLRCILLLLSISPLAETCVPTVPPEEYYPTASLPEETTQPMQVTPVTAEMSTTAGGGGATVASTTAEENMCADCDINEIAPTTVPVDTEFNSAELDPVDGCKQTYTICRRTDDKQCEVVYMYAENPTGLHSVTDLSSGTSVITTFSCDADGTYSWQDIKQISQLTCVYMNCI